MTLQFHDLLAKGYFPKELPPPFSTTDYASAVAGPQSTGGGVFASGAPDQSMLCTPRADRRPAAAPRDSEPGAVLSTLRTRGG